MIVKPGLAGPGYPDHCQSSLQDTAFPQPGLTHRLAPDYC